MQSTVNKTSTFLGLSLRYFCFDVSLMTRHQNLPLLQVTQMVECLVGKS